MHSTLYLQKLTNIFEFQHFKVFITLFSFRINKFQNLNFLIYELQDLQTFIDTSENGFIYVSLGSLIDPECAQEVGTKLINIFQKIPYQIIWKWKTNLINQTFDRLRIGEWFPQIDILSK